MKIAIFVLNLLLGLVFSTAFALAVSRQAEGSALVAAVLRTWWAGLTVGVTIGLAATVGSRPILGPVRCILAHGIVLAISAAGAFIGSFFNQELQQGQQILSSLLARHNIAIGSGIGAVLGTVIEFIHIYDMRKKDRRK